MISGVLAVVGVVAAPDAARAEAERLVELDRAGVRDAHLERVAAPPVAGRLLEEVVEQRARDPAAPVGPESTATFITCHAST